MRTKQELQQHLDWINENLEPLNEKKKALENAIKAIDEPEFDFEKLMPVGSVWLGNENLRVKHTSEAGKPPVYFETMSADKAYKEIYYAHQIVKEVQECFKDMPCTFYESPISRLLNWLQAAKKAGVLQNLD